MFEIIGPKKVKMGERVVEFPCSIQGYYKNDPRVVEFDGLVIVNFYPYSREDDRELIKSGVDGSRNIWAFDQQGNKVWEVESLETKLPQLNTSYTFVSVRDERLIGYNDVGYHVEIDPKDGSIEFYPKDQGRPW